jgi:Tfp pilus assembly protein PilX
MNTSRQKGVALIMALILLVVLSVMGVSLMFLSQTETWSSMNYRLMNQARDVAEAGVNSAANFILYSYTPPATAGSDPLSAYAGINCYPVTTTSGCAAADTVILSANTGVTSHYPVTSVQTSFNTSGVGKGSLTAGNTTINYNTHAKLLSMRQVNVYASATPATVQTWLITSDATITGIPNAQVEVSAIIEREAQPVFNYAAFATSGGCSALTFGGGGSTNSYDSTAALVGGVPVTANRDANIGTNGNLSTVGSTTTINGSLSTPRSGVGTCSSSNVTAWTSNNGTVTGGINELPQPVNYPTPDAPNPMPPTTNVVLNNNNCSSISNCTGNNGTYSFTPGTAAAPTTFGNVTLNGSATLHFSAGYYNINSLLENGSATIVIDSAPVIVNLAGAGLTSSQAVLDLTGGGLTNTAGNFDPKSLQFLYAGTNPIKLKGGADAVGLLYAPNAAYSFNSAGGNWYGAVIGATLTDMGGAGIHYDRHLQNSDFILGNYMLSSFTWKKY